VLERVGLSSKTRFEKGAFTTMDLSTGQRKRLALALAMLDDRDVYVFDEVASEQDSAFCERIYHEFFQELKAKNKAILAITHDDRYFPTADRVYIMSDGRLQLREI
jgi:putative ATP-binding cassette transporter